jgi:uncharacterized protein YkwD
MSTKRALAGVVAVLVASIVFTPATPGAAPSESNHSQCWKTKATERAFARRIDRARERNGKSRLRSDPELAKAARSHTQGMVNRGKLYHTPGDRLSTKVTNWTVLGENVGVGSGVAELHRAFMDSEGHRENVLYPSYTFVGVGVVERNDRMWVTVVFESRTDPGTTQRMPRC